MDYINSDRLLFVVASAGGGGHKLGRIISCIDNVYWYLDKDTNGLNPWDIFYTNLIKGKTISPYHFDRTIGKHVIPLIGERAECYWNKDDIDVFYKKIWTTAMETAGASKIIETGKYLLWVLHDTPQYLISRFPNSKIINLIDENIDIVIDRYLKTTALFPITINNKNIKPDYINDYACKLKELKEINPAPSYRDFWSWDFHSEPVYIDELYLEYRKYVSSMLSVQYQHRIKENPKYINITWDNLNIDFIVNYLNAKSINKNYIKLLQ